MAKQIGIGIIGVGSIVDIGHCPAIRKTENARLVAMYDPNPETLEKMAKKWSPEKTYTDFEAILADKDIQVVIIASPNRFHAQQAIDAMRAKKHVIVEKPFACTHDEAWAMVKVCREEGVFLMAGTNQRFWEQNQIARSLMDDGYIGQPMMGRSSLHEGYSLYHDQLSYTPFRSDAHLAGAGALYDLGAHRADLLVYLMGSRPKRVNALIKKIVMPDEYTVLDDSFFITVEFENGATGMISGDRFSPCVSNITEIYGVDGMLFTSCEATNPFQSVPLAVYSNKDFKQSELPDVIREFRYPQLFWSEDIMTPDGNVPKRWVPIYTKRDWSYHRMLEHFIDCVMNDVPPSLTPEESALIVDLLVGAYKSSETGLWVDLPLDEEYIVPHYDAPGLKL